MNLNNNDFFEAARIQDEARAYSRKHGVNIVEAYQLTNHQVIRSADVIRQRMDLYDAYIQELTDDQLDEECCNPGSTCIPAFRVKYLPGTSTVQVWINDCASILLECENQSTKNLDTYPCFRYDVINQARK